MPRHTLTPEERSRGGRKPIAWAVDYGNGKRSRPFTNEADAQAFADSEAAILRNPQVRVVPL